MMIDNNSLPGKVLGTCTLEHLLSQGGMGSVYLARQQRPRRTVAIKVLLAGSVLQERAQADFLTRFRREADAIAALDHIHIMPIYEYGEQDQLAYLVMPYITGGTLHQRLVERGALPLHEILPILEQAAEALDYAHERGIIHRDIKPSNMLFHADGRLLLTDFGLAKMLSESGAVLPMALPEGADQEETQALPFAHARGFISESTQAISLPFSENKDAEATRQIRQDMTSFSSEAVIGTPEYLAPERALGQPVDRRADIYSLGITLFRMLTGQVPFAGSSAVSTALMHTQDEPPRPSELVPDLAPEVEAVTLRAIAKDPAQRYNTAGDFARALREAVAHAGLLTSSTENHSGHVSSPKPVRSAIGATNIIIRETSRPNRHAEQPRRTVGGVRNALLLVFCSLLILGGAFSYLAEHTALQHPVSAHTHATPTIRPTARPTSTATTQPIASSALVLVGAQLYTSALLSSACAGVPGTWSQDSNASVTCQTTATELANKLPPTVDYLAGMFLNGFPNGSGIPNNYVLQVEAVQQPGSQGDFGVLFRNQPDENGHRHNGAYALLINPNDGTWKAVVYDDQSGLPTYFASGQFSAPPNKSITIDIMLQENTFTFYLNGARVSRVTGPPTPSYSVGTIGFIVSTNTMALFRNLAVYRLPDDSSN